MLKVSVFGAALLLAGCVSSGVVFEDEPVVEEVDDLQEVRRPRGLPICPPGYVNPHPYVTCITPRPEPTR